MLAVVIVIVTVAADAATAAAAVAADVGDGHATGHASAAVTRRTVVAGGGEGVGSSGGRRWVARVRHGSQRRQFGAEEVHLAAAEILPRQLHGRQRVGMAELQMMFMLLLLLLLMMMMIMMIMLVLVLVLKLKMMMLLLLLVVIDFRQRVQRQRLVHDIGQRVGRIERRRVRRLGPQTSRRFDVGVHAVVHDGIGVVHGVAAAAAADDGRQERFAAERRLFQQVVQQVGRVEQVVQVVVVAFQRQPAVVRMSARTFGARFC